jgi:hypothetical protein
MVAGMVKFEAVGQLLATRRWDPKPKKDANGDDLPADPSQFFGSVAVIGATLNVAFSTEAEMKAAAALKGRLVAVTGTVSYTENQFGQRTTFHVESLQDASKVK